MFEVMRRRRYLPFPSSPRTLQEIEVTRLSVCVATAVESQLRFPTVRLPLKLERGARPPIYLPFPSSPRTLQEIEVTRLSVCVATAVESQLRFPTAVESQTCLSVCVPTAVESQALSGQIKHSESLIYPY